MEMIASLSRLSPRLAVVRSNTRVIRQICITPLFTRDTSSHYSRIRESVRCSTTMSNNDARRRRPLVNIQGFNDIANDKKYTLKYIMYLLPYSLTHLLTYSYSYSLICLFACEGTY